MFPTIHQTFTTAYAATIPGGKAQAFTYHGDDWQAAIELAERHGGIYGVTKEEVLEFMGFVGRGPNETYAYATDTGWCAVVIAPMIVKPGTLIRDYSGNIHTFESVERKQSDTQSALIRTDRGEFIHTVFPGMEAPKEPREKVSEKTPIGTIVARPRPQARNRDDLEYGWLIANTGKYITVKAFHGGTTTEPISHKAFHVVTTQPEFIIPKFNN